MAQPLLWRLTEADAAAAGAVLARAFLDEPIFLAALPDPAALARFLPRHFAANIRYGCRFGEAWAVGTAPGTMAGAAFWIAIPHLPLTPELAAAIGYAGEEADPVWGPALARMRRLVEEADAGLAGMPARWRYLDAIGVDPDWQGQGLGSALLGKIVTDAAAAGLPVGLATDRPANLPFYRRAGFAVTWEGRSSDGAIPIWSLRTHAP
jgi:GNAT superfamily N-acetyltransferase